MTGRRVEIHLILARRLSLYSWLDRYSVPVLVIVTLSVLSQRDSKIYNPSSEVE